MRIKAVIFDWAGTTVDFGCCGPVIAIRAAFEKLGIVLNEADARRHMGLLKRDHISAILAIPSVADSWTSLKGTPSGEVDIDEIYDVFMALQEKSLRAHATLISGVLAITEQLRTRGIRIGSTTGYTRSMLAPISLEAAAMQGYSPDASVTPDEVGKGRPAPFMMLENLVRLNVWPLSSVVKVGDTPVDIDEGLSAGVWTVGVAGTGNGIGMSLSAFSDLPEMTKQAKFQTARQELKSSGAHFVIDSLAELSGVIDEIESGSRVLSAAASSMLRA